jgi:stalled ribosome rescue protein Dom34
MDHKEARIFQIHPDQVDEAVVSAPLHSTHHKHPPGSVEPKEHPNDAKHFFQDLARAVAHIDEILVVGPSTAKLDFMRWVREHDRALEPKIIGVETVDHPSNAQVVAFAKDYFKRKARVRS